MRRHILFGALLLSPRCFGWVEPEVVRKTLEVPVEIQGYPCAKGFAWFFADGHLKQCTVSRETAFGEARAPTGSIVVPHRDGTPNYFFSATMHQSSATPAKVEVRSERPKGQPPRFILAASSSSAGWRRTRLCRECLAWPPAAS